MATMIKQVWKHTHDCPRKDELLIVRPECREGVAFLRDPVCIEESRFQGTGLALIDTQYID